MEKTQSARYWLGVILLGLVALVAGIVVGSTSSATQVAAALTLGGVMAVLVGLVRAGLCLVRHP